MSDPTAKIKTSKEQEMKMEKNSMAIMDEALYILKQKYADTPHLAYATFAGYCIALVDLKTANTVLDVVKENN